MDLDHIAGRRLRAHRLTGERFASPLDVVGAMVAVQAQDYPAAKWSLGLRSETSDREVEALFNTGAILRTHVMRPTWHFVLPRDIRWLLELTGPRLRAGLRGRHRQLEIDDETALHAKKVFSNALSKSGHLTRAQLGQELTRAGISPAGQRLPHLLLLAEVEGLVISGPRVGRELTFALLEDRAPNAPSLERDAALGLLAERYFRSHGPAQLADFTWWSGLTMVEARRGIEIAAPSLQRDVIEGADHWSAATDRNQVSPESVHLLPNFDEYTVAYRDRRALRDGSRVMDERLFSFGSILSNVVLRDGRVIGAWKRSGSQRGRIALRMLQPSLPDDEDVVRTAAAMYSRFLESRLEPVFA